MSDREHRVREIAHRLWEDEGRPSDQEKRHWATAERMFDAQATAEGAAGTSKPRTTRKSAKRTPPATQTSAARPH
jgi:DUF2934 family protein